MSISTQRDVLNRRIDLLIEKEDILEEAKKSISTCKLKQSKGRWRKFS